MVLKSVLGVEVGALSESRKIFREKARKALTKKSMYGPDVDLEPYIRKAMRDDVVSEIIDVKDPRIQAKLESVGINVFETEITGHRLKCGVMDIKGLQHQM